MGRPVGESLFAKLSENLLIVGVIFELLSCAAGMTMADTYGVANWRSVATGITDLAALILLAIARPIETERARKWGGPAGPTWMRWVRWVFIVGAVVNLAMKGSVIVLCALARVFCA